MKILNIRMRRITRRFCISRPQALWHRYIIGFLFIFATISVSHWASFATIAAAEDDAEVLQISSRQKMLSQRILFLMAETEKGKDRHIESRLESALDLFEMSHDALVSRADLSPELRTLYFEKEPISLDAFSRRFVQLVGIAASAEGAQADELNEVLVQWGTHDLMISLATATDLFRQSSEARITRLQKIQKATLTAALVVLLIEALVIFLPAQLSVNRAIHRLERRKKQLKSSMDALKARNSELIAARQSLTRAANHDALTGLLNRRAIYDHLSAPGPSTQGGDFTRAIMKIDLDLFKQVNDSLGHDAGDRVLVRVAKILNEETRPNDFTGRIGGDEFVILIDNPPNLEMVEDLSRRIINAVGEPIDLDGIQAKIGASVGFTIATSSSATPDQLLIEADLALYEAKRAGRSQACAYSRKLAVEIETRRILFDEINAALTGDQFEPYFQPQVFTETGEIYGCEVLARWRHPERGIVPPATFIAAAEEAGMIAQIDQMMVEKGLDALEAFMEMGIHLPGISVNASPPTLRDPHLTDRLLQAVHARHLSPSVLTVEVLESTLIENDDDMALMTIENLSKSGFSVVLDDFGTGYASMSNLSRLRLNAIKLDQSLILPVPEPRADSIVSALVSLSRDLDMRVVAEGVETPEHFATVRDLGCDVVQGFGIGKPMPQDAFVEWYKNYATAPMQPSKSA